MKHLLPLLAALLLTLPGADALAQKAKSADDYNLKKAYEVLDEEHDEDKALELVNRQLRDTPDHVRALLLRVNLLRHRRDRAAALSDLNHALRVNKPKQSGIANSTLHWWKATLYNDMRDFDNAAVEFRMACEMARKDNRDNLQEISFDYAQCLFQLDRLDDADAVYRAMLAEDEADQSAMTGLARNMIQRKEYRQALELLNKAQKYDADYSSVYQFKMQALRGLGEDTKAIDAALDWFDKDEGAFSDSLVAVLTIRPNYAEANIKARTKSAEEPLLWQALLGDFYEHLHRYAEAVRVYDGMEAEFGYFDQICTRRADCYAELGLYDRAIADISKAMEKDAAWTEYCDRGIYYAESGDLGSAIRDFEAAMEAEPRAAFPYYRRGWCYEMLGDRTRALADYDLGIELEEDYPYLYLMRGELRLADGNTELARADFEQVLQRDTVVRDGSCRQYALHFLGRDDEAEAWMDRIIASDPENAGHYYDRACLFARMGRLSESVAALRTAFEKGYRSFAHIRLDDDMDPVRELPEFQALIAEYEAVHTAYLEANELSDPKEQQEERVTEIAVKRNPGGTFAIPCDINGLALQMIFDTGASDVTISSVEANFMLKNGYLSEKDVKGKRYYQIADGQISEGTVVTLREVKIGDAVLRNVDASVVRSQSAPLLLGQSAMERFGTITIDNANNKLIIKH